MEVWWFREAQIMACPKFLAATLIKRLSVYPPPSESSTRRAELAFDQGLSLFHRQQYDRDAVRFGWTDSSPMGGFDWLWSQVHTISRRLLLQTVKAIQ